MPVTTLPSTGQSVQNANPPVDVEETVELTPEEIEAQEQARQQLLTHVRGDDLQQQEHVDQILQDIIDQGTNLKDEAPSATALRLDKWDMRRGKEISETNPKMKAAEIDENEAADLHGACFLPEPELHPKCIDKLRGDFLKQMMETVEYQELHDQTMGDDFASEVASGHFAESYAKVRKQQADINKENAQRAKNGQPAKTGPGSQPNVIGAVAKALGNASQAVQEYADACSAMGWGGPGGGSESGKIDPARVTKMMSRINKSQNLKKILEWAGRFKIVASSCQREKTTIGNDEVVGVMPDNALERMLPQEFLYLDDELTEAVFFSRYLERKTLCREFRAQEPQGRGPIVCIVDESGSMGGDRIETAKGMMLAIGWIARKQKRWLTLAAFSGDTKVRIETFPVGNWDESKMMDWLEKFIGGGTVLDGPFKTVPDYLDKLPNCPKGKIDFILLTDGEMDCSEELKASFKKWKEANKVRLLSIIIQSSPGILATISDEVYNVNSLSLDSDATHAAFSI